MIAASTSGRMALQKACEVPLGCIGSSVRVPLIPLVISRMYRPVVLYRTVVEPLDVDTRMVIFDSAAMGRLCADMGRAR